MKIRKIRETELQKISGIDKEFYEGYQTPLEVLVNWFNNFPEGFLVAEEADDIFAYIFVELFDGIKAVPFIHDARLAHYRNGKFIYVSGFGVKDGFEKAGNFLLEEIITLGKVKNCKAIVWVTGEKMKHDIFEKRLIQEFGFAKKERIEKWESHPNRFVSDHAIWIKEL